MEGPRALLVAADLDELLAGNLLQEVDALVWLQVLDELGAKEVAVLAHHEVCELSVHLIDDLVDQLLVRVFEVILQEHGADLFGGELHDVAVEHAELFVRVALGHLDVMLDLRNELIVRLVAAVLACVGVPGVHLQGHALH